jgi:hypothetical protein
MAGKVVILCVISAALSCRAPQPQTPPPTQADTDRDGIPDACDKCPHEPESIDCPVADGCPGSHCRASCADEGTYTHRRVAISFQAGGTSLQASAREALNGEAQALRDPRTTLYVCSECTAGNPSQRFLRRLGSIRDHLRAQGVHAGKIETGLHCLEKASVDSLLLSLITVQGPRPVVSRPAPKQNAHPMPYAIRLIRIEVERQADGKKYPNYLKESYELTSDSVLKYFGYFGGMPLNMNHTDSIEWKAGHHGHRVLAAVTTVVSDPTLFADLEQVPDEGESPCAQTVSYSIGLTKDEADVTFCVRKTKRVFSMLDRAFREMVAGFERDSGRPLTPAKLPQGRP